jgi:MFS family permease
MDASSHIERRSPGLTRGAALTFVILLGLVSLFADMTYEGARSITGPYLAVLGASATVVGIVAGFGELIGYLLRLVAGYLSDRTGRYWTFTLVGYVINLLAVPCLAFAGRWELAAGLMIAERFGKAMRTPARDAMLSHATTEMGRGWGFRLHEAMDQIGALLGPLIVAVVLFRREGYATAFGVLFIPAVLALSVLVLACLRYPDPRDFEIGTPPLETQGFPRVFWLYLAAIGLIAAGYADFPLIAYHLHKTSLVSAGWIPLFYAVAMGVDAVAALVCGRLFDRLGFPVLGGVALVSCLFAPLVFLGPFHVAMLGMVLWGIGMGAQESIMRAAVAGMVPARGPSHSTLGGCTGLVRRHRWV